MRHEKPSRALSWLNCAGLAGLLAGSLAIAQHESPPAAANKPGAKVQGPPPEAQTPTGAQAQLQPTQGHEVAGTLSLVEDKDGVHIAGQLRGFEPGSVHGFHVHEKGDCSAPDASSAGEHWNPHGQSHGKPDGTSGHLGDVPNLRANAQGIVQVDVRIAAATLRTGQADDIIDKALVVHARPDDYKSQPAGNSGDRIACAVIK